MDWLADSDFLRCMLHGVNFHNKCATIQKLNHFALLWFSSPTISWLCLADKDEASITEGRDLCFVSNDKTPVGKGVDREILELTQRWTEAWRKPSFSVSATQ
jgi:hypothetical protein